MNSKFIGGLLLIVGTSIGGGMLALPVANAATGFWHSSIFFLLCWAIMAMGAFYILEVNLYLPPGKNMLSMAHSTLGTPGLLITWLCYLTLLYTLLAGYISGGADVMGGLLHKLHIQLASWQLILLFTVLFGAVVYHGIRAVDLLNRVLMCAKLGVFVLLLCLITPYAHTENLHTGEFKYITGPLMILITSFAFATIVPNLREYFNDDLQSLKRVIFFGSLTPLICYLAWDAVIMGSLPTTGNHPLTSLMDSAHPTSSLAEMISYTIQNKTISAFFNFFTAICMLTAFLGVALCLISFLADGIKIEQKGYQGMVLFVLTFLPPVTAVIYYPAAFMHALKYAGFLCVILLLLLPVLMSMYGRKRYSSSFVVPGGKLCQLLVLLMAVLLMIIAILTR